MEIYGPVFSAYVARVVLAARYKGIKHTLALAKDGLKSPAYLKINPLGKVPALKDGKLVLYESSVLVEYLDAKSKAKKMVPSAAKAAAKVRLIAAIFGEYVQGPFSQLYMHMNPATRDQAYVDTKVAEINKALDIAEGMIGKPFAAGKFSIADCYALPALFYVENMLPALGVRNPLGNRPKLVAYRARLAKDKVTGKLLAEMAESLRAFMASQPST